MKAVILLSGGLDSSTVLYQAKADGCECYAISFNYQQRHSKELHSAYMVAKAECNSLL
jgi:7-cyano-7-deazaguanine synthase